MSDDYEALRTAALGEGLPIETRSGLALFLRRGMWGWVQAALVPPAIAHLPRARFANSNASAEDRTVIHLVAAMAMRPTNRRAHERVP